jgi:hypothetical protein
MAIIRVVHSYLFAVWMLLLAIPASAEDRLSADARADRVDVLKKERTLTLMSGDKLLKT